MRVFWKLQNSDWFSCLLEPAKCHLKKEWFYIFSTFDRKQHTSRCVMFRILFLKYFQCPKQKKTKKAESFEKTSEDKKNLRLFWRPQNSDWFSCLLQPPRYHLKKNVFTFFRLLIANGTLLDVWRFGFCFLKLFNVRNKRKLKKRSRLKKILKTKSKCVFFEGLKMLSHFLGF